MNVDQQHAGGSPTTEKERKCRDAFLALALGSMAVRTSVFSTGKLRKFWKWNRRRFHFQNFARKSTHHRTRVQRQSGRPFYRSRFIFIFTDRIRPKRLTLSLQERLILLAGLGLRWKGRGLPNGTVPLSTVCCTRV